MQQPDTVTPVVEGGMREYRPLSRLAIASLVLGILSVTAMFYPLFWSVPVAGVVCSLLALRWVGRRSEELSGRGLAVVGLLLSLLLGAWAVTHHYARREALIRNATPVADAWFERVRQGRLEEAHQMLLSPSQRRPPGTDLAAYYEKDENARRDMEDLFRGPALRALIDHADQGRLEFERVVEIDRDEGLDYLILEYSHHFQQDGQPRRHLLRVRLMRRFDPHEGIALWSVLDAYRTPPEQS